MSDPMTRETTKVGDLVTLTSSGRLMKVVQVHAKTQEVCVVPAYSQLPHIGVWLKKTYFTEVNHSEPHSKNLIK